MQTPQAAGQTLPWTAPDIMQAADGCAEPQPLCCKCICRQRCACSQADHCKPLARHGHAFKPTGLPCRHWQWLKMAGAPAQCRLQQPFLGQGRLASWRSGTPRCAALPPPAEIQALPAALLLATPLIVKPQRAEPEGRRAMAPPGATERCCRCLLVLPGAECGPSLPLLHEARSALRCPPC